MSRSFCDKREHALTGRRKSIFRSRGNSLVEASEVEVLLRLEQAQRTSRFIVQFMMLSSGGRRGSVLDHELSSGETLKTLLFDEKLHLQESLMYCAEIALALDHLAMHGIVHGDLRPEVVGLSQQGHVRIMNFHSAKTCESRYDFVELSSKPACVAYASPEVLSEKKLTVASDWWSLGVMLFEMLFRSSPWLAKDERALVGAICSLPPMFPKSELECTGPMKEAVRALLRKDAESRTSELDELQYLSLFRRVNWDNVREERWHTPLHSLRDTCESKCASARF